MPPVSLSWQSTQMRRVGTDTYEVMSQGTYDYPNSSDGNNKQLPDSLV